MQNWKSHLINHTATIKQAMTQLDRLGIVNAVLFVTDETDCLYGSITDGDIRRALLNNAGVDESVESVCNRSCKILRTFQPSSEEIKSFSNRNIRFVPVVGDQMLIQGILDLNHYKAVLPVDAVLMAGGKGQRLMPLTLDTPKPLLKVGAKPIIEHNIDRLARFGVENIHLSINYLGDKIRNYFGDGSEKSVNIRYIEEVFPMGTIGSVRQVRDFREQHILIMNSDILTNIDFEEFYHDFISSGADMSVAATSYHVDIPYAVMEVDGENCVKSLKEKPRYTYFSNAGIYLIKKELLTHIPDNKFFNITDLMEEIIRCGKKLITYPILGYWLDIGRMEDYRKAQEDIKHLNL